MLHFLFIKYLKPKKTSTNYRKNYTINAKDTFFFETVMVLNNIYNEIINLIIGKKQFDIKNKVIFTNYIINKINKIISKLASFTCPMLENKSPIILFFIHSISSADIDLNKLLIIYECFIRKIRKNNITVDNIKDYIYHKNHPQRLSALSPHKYINRLFSQ